tara:strand:+ start:1418 stop:1579 length:162 start_codon:yes stop_codon:yes gene_type:complete
MLKEYPKGVIIMKAIARPVVAMVEVVIVLIAFIFCLTVAFKSIIFTHNHKPDY